MKKLSALILAICLSLETALDGLSGAKLHPGAEKFFKEKGIL